MEILYGRSLYLRNNRRKDLEFRFITQDIMNCLEERGIIHFSFVRCQRCSETMFHFLWTFPSKRTFIHKLKYNLQLKFLNMWFGKPFFLFGLDQFTRNVAIFVQYIRFCTMWATQRHVIFYNITLYLQFLIKTMFLSFSSIR